MSASFHRIAFIKPSLHGRPFHCNGTDERLYAPPTERNHRDHSLASLFIHRRIADDTDREVYCSVIS